LPPKVIERKLRFLVERAEPQRVVHGVAVFWFDSLEPTTSKDLSGPDVNIYDGPVAVHNVN
jgi:hypothetical protein